MQLHSLWHATRHNFLVDDFSFSSHLRLFFWMTETILTQTTKQNKKNEENWEKRKTNRRMSLSFCSTKWENFSIELIKLLWVFVAKKNAPNTKTIHFCFSAQTHRNHNLSESSTRMTKVSTRRQQTRQKRMKLQWEKISFLTRDATFFLKVKNEFIFRLHFSVQFKVAVVAIKL